MKTKNLFTSNNNVRLNIEINFNETQNEWESVKLMTTSKK